MAQHPRRIALRVAWALACAAGLAGVGYWWVGWREVAVSITASSDAPARFDLVCEGFEILGVDTTGPYQSRVRVDLEQGNYCEGDCRRPLQFGTASPGELVLSYGTGRHLHYQTLTREAGARIRLTDYFGSNHDRTATCSVAPFSGFPHLEYPLAPAESDRRLEANWSRFPEPMALEARYPTWRRVLGIGANLRFQCVVDRTGELTACRPGSVAQGLSSFARDIPSQFRMARRAWPSKKTEGAIVNLTVRVHVEPGPKGRSDPAKAEPYYPLCSDRSDIPCRTVILP